MSESIFIDKGLDKQGTYQQLILQLKALTEGEPDMIANMANVSAALKEVFEFWWVGFYLVKNDELVLGPFQGPIACTRISFDRGVCGACYTKKESVLVPDVDAFPGHIACSSATRSEVVVPVWNTDKTQIIAVLDVDSEHLNYFDLEDLNGLEEIAGLFS